MHTFYLCLAFFVGGSALGAVFGSRVKSATMKELNQLRASAADAIKPKG
jgi:hypothetical protein